jgi:hypothetical protein
VSLFKDWINVLKEPESFYSQSDISDGASYPLKFAVVMIVISASIKSITIGLSYSNIITLGRTFQGSLLLRFLTDAGSFAPQGAATLIFFDALIGGLLLLFLEGAIIYLFVKIFGGSGSYMSTVSAIAFYTALSPIMALSSVLPFGAIITGVVRFYGIYIVTRGVEQYNSMKFSMALLAVLAPLILSFIFGFTFAIGANLSVN